MPHTLLASTKPAAEPARCLCRLVLDDGIKLVCRCVDLLAGLVQLLLSKHLCMLVLLFRIGAVSIEPLLQSVRLRLGLVGLVEVRACCKQGKTIPNLRIVVR